MTVGGVPHGFHLLACLHVHGHILHVPVPVLLGVVTIPFPFAIDQQSVVLRCVVGCVCDGVNLDSVPA